MLKRSPPSISPPKLPRPEDEDHDRKSLQAVEENMRDGAQGRLIISSSGVAVDDTERTPLLPKSPPVSSSHPNWIRGERDLEGQALKRKGSWHKFQEIVSWPREKGYDFVVTVFNPKRWNGQAIWRNAVVAPVGYFPAAVLGTLLNILDALSYGMSPSGSIAVGHF